MWDEVEAFDEVWRPTSSDPKHDEPESHWDCEDCSQAIDRDMVWRLCGRSAGRVSNESRDILIETEESVMSNGTESNGGAAYNIGLGQTVQVDRPAPKPCPS